MYDIFICLWIHPSSIFETIRRSPKCKAKAGRNRLKEEEAYDLLSRFQDAKALVSSLADCEELPKEFESYGPSSRVEFMQGQVLLTHPISCVRCAYFDRAVVLINRVSPTEIAGFVVNKPLKSLQQLLERAQKLDQEWGETLQADLSEVPIYRGGPIVVGSSLRENLHWLHDMELPGARPIGSGLYLSGDAKEILRSESSFLRVCFGYAGWRPLQLQLELEMGIWLRANGWRPGGEELWRHSLRATGLAAMAAFPRGRELDETIRRHIQRQSGAPPSTGAK